MKERTETEAIWKDNNQYVKEKQMTSGRKQATVQNPAATEGKQEAG
jgi:hypothetical protein